MISFYPGPSRTYDEIPKYVKDAHRKGIVSISHRSEEFMEICQKTVELLKEKLNVPNNYTVFFASSATECWEIIAQSLITKTSSHYYNGSFGEKWYEYTKRLVPGATGIPFEKEKRLIVAPTSKFICLTQNETSNGTELSASLLRSIRKNNPDSIIAIDATSSMAGVELPIKTADVWFASVQKCFGLPAGLAIMICSTKAIDRMKSINEKNHYNSLVFMNEMMARWQTPYTPNVLGIYLLMRVLKKVKPIRQVDKKITTRATEWVEFFKQSQNLKLYIRNAAVRSRTVLTISCDPDLISVIKKTAKGKGILLGDGYGALKKDTFRIANFPAIKQKEIKTLKQLLRHF